MEVSLVNGKGGEITIITKVKWGEERRRKI
jgi:hypothetical protein